MSSQVENEEHVVVQQPGVDNPSASTPYESPPTGGYQPPNTTCPPGLEYLIPLDIVFLDQRIDPFQIVSGIQVANRYTVVDTHGQLLYVIREKSHWFTRMAMGTSRSFRMPIHDKNGREVLSIKRPLRWIGDSMTVYCDGRILLGTIKKTILSCIAQYCIYDENGVEELQIRGPPMWLVCGRTHEFEVVAPNGDHIGMIQKQWAGFMREMFTNADIFGVSYGRNLSVKAKALLLAAAILIDFDYFEEDPRISTVACNSFI